MTISQARQATIYRMVMPEHECPFGLKARDLLRRRGYVVEDRWLTSRAETDAFKQVTEVVGSGPFRFLAGQYVEILLKDGRRRAFSLANAPHDDVRLQLHIRRIPGGNFTEHVFTAMKERVRPALPALFGSGDVGLGRYPASATLNMTVLQEMRDLVAVPGMNHEVDAVGVLMDIFY